MEAKVFERCELAKELLKNNIPRPDLGKWMCIAEYESHFNTKAHGKLNSDGSSDNGIFQINDRYWCQATGGANVCKIPCSKLRDDNISDDISCALKIQKSQGFTAWTVWNRSCVRKNLSDYTKGCKL